MTQQKVIPPLTEAPAEGSISDEYFYRMLSPQALMLSASYHREESNVLEACLKNNRRTRKMNFVAVGGGELWELRRALKYTKSYTCIEPLADVFMNSSVKFLMEQFKNITYVPKRFGEVVASDLPRRNNFFMFLFNILAYIDDPIEIINRLTKPGDILFISTWADTEEALERRNTYFEYLNSFDEHITIDPDDTVGRCHLDSFPFEQLQYFKKSERYTGTVADTLIIYL